MDTTDYTKEINSSPYVLVEFFATWCPHCQRMMPIVADVKTKLEGKVKVLQFDVDKNTELSEAEKIESLPTFIVYANGKEVMRDMGEMPEDVLLQKVENAIAD